MPISSDKTIADRDAAYSLNMHPRLGGTMILEPDDVLEGRGDFVYVDGLGFPVGWRLGSPEAPVRRMVYIGLSRDATVRQTHRGIPYDRPSFAATQALLEEGPLPPTEDTPLLAKIPRPGKPILKTMPADKAGYAASTPQSPHWFAWARVRNGRLTLASPPVSFHLDHGQSARVPLPEREGAVSGVDEWALLMAEPGTSRPDRPGPMFVQQIVDLNRYFLPYYDLTGPFRNDRPAATTNQTILPKPGRPNLSRRSTSVASRVAEYRGVTTWTDEDGESLASSYDTYTIYEDSSYSYTPSDDSGGEEIVAGRGYVTITRSSTPPPGATGWRAYVYLYPVAGSGDAFPAAWHRVVNRFTGEGGEKPWPLSKRTVETAGWTGSEEPYGINDSVILEQAELPTENTTGVANPEGRPEPPERLGASRLDPDRYFVRVTDVIPGGLESLPSEAVEINLGADEVLRIVFANPDNRFANPTFVEVTPDLLPLDFQVVKTGGDAQVIGEDFVLWTNGVQTGTTPSFATDPIEVDPNVSTPIESKFVLENPESGTLAGMVEVAVREYGPTGLTSDTVLFTATAPGEYEIERTMEAVGTVGALLAWKADTVRHEVIHRFSGASKNLKLRAKRVGFREQRHKPVREHRRAEQPTPLGVPQTTVQDPPEPPHAPEGYAVNWPDRPLSEGTILEDVALTSAPPGWTQRVSGVSLTFGAGGMKVSKGVV